MVRMADKRRPRPARIADAQAKNDSQAGNKILLAAATWAVLFCATLVAYGPALRGGLLGRRRSCDRP